jgi:hypothetical protein
MLWDLFAISIYCMCFVLSAYYGAKALQFRNNYCSRKRLFYSGDINNTFARDNLGNLVIKIRLFLFLSDMMKICV